MVTLTTADNALKKVYLGVVANELNNATNPLYNKIVQSTADVWGKNIIKLAPYGLNGGIGAGTEEGNLPASGENKYVTLTSGLKNLYGMIEITDKAIRASATDAGAFVNLLNAEMEGLLNASKFNLSRMLYGDGSGLLADVTAAVVATGLITVSSVKNLMEGIVVDFYKSGAAVTGLVGVRIESINRTAKQIKVSAALPADIAANPTAYKIYVQGSKDNELTGLGAIFNTGLTSLYGVTKANHGWMNPYAKAKGTTEAFDDMLVQTAIDEVARNYDSVTDFMVCDSATRRAFQAYLTSQRMNLDIVELSGGYKTMSYNGIPVVSDRFAPAGTLYMLNTKDFCIHQLCDWQWLEAEDGSILKQKSGFPIYTATLVKYADLICSKPGGQAMLTNLV
ncbi:MAG: phage major capsid protein [Firmicutes bacterium]|nr:phage major capsid protein [Bacillota bacterium]